MKVKEYLETLKKYDSITFIIESAVKSDGATYYHEEYRTTPMRSVEEWLEGNGKHLDFVVMNANQPPIGWGGAVNWIEKYNRGQLKCLLITSEECLRKRYPREEQYNSILDMVDREIKK